MLNREAKYQRKVGGKFAGDKWNYRKLDRKSSRGMIYENEELRLRTININAEVERGQADIRKLRRENEQLRREIWSLRDEYDRLDKLLRTKKTTSDSCDNDENLSGSQSEDSDSCDTCKDDDLEEEEEEQEDIDDDENECSDNKNSNNRSSSITDESLSQKEIQSNYNNQEIAENYENSQKTLEANNCNNSNNSNNTTLGNNSKRDILHVNFDHLSIVSEENLTNSDGNSVNHCDMDSNQIPLIPVPMPHEITSSISPIDLQTTVPPLSHFENIAYDDLGPNLASIEDINYSTSTTTTGETVIPANGWDFNITSSRFNNSTIDLKHLGEILPPPPPPPPPPVPALPSSQLQQKLGAAYTNGSGAEHRSPKHFFSPIKPRLRIDGSNQSIPVSKQNNGTGPDVFVTNALASPYNQRRQYQQQNSSKEPIYAAIEKDVSYRTSGSSTFQNGGNLEDLLMDIESLSKDILKMQLEKQKSYSQEKLGSNENFSNSKPYRSEMNLVLTYNGSNPVITPIVKATSASSAQGLGVHNKLFDNDNMDTPPPNLPEPMILFPQNLAYFGFENFGQPSGHIVGVGNSGMVPPNTTVIGSLPTIRSPINISQPDYHQQVIVGGGGSGVGGDLGTVLEKGSMPVGNYNTTGGGESIGELGGLQLNDQFIDDCPVHIATPTVLDMPPPPPPQIGYDSPEFTRKTPAMMRRKLFTNRSTDDSQQSAGGGGAGSSSAGGGIGGGAGTGGSIDGKILERKIEKMQRTESSASDNANCDSSSGSEANKRKARRVSIIFNGRKSDDSNKDKDPDSKHSSTSETVSRKTQSELNNNHKSTTGPTAVASLSSSLPSGTIPTTTKTITTTASTLPTSIADTILGQRTSSSTPSSPHSGGRRSSTAHHQHHHHHHANSHHHHHQRHTHGRKMSQDSVRTGLSSNLGPGNSYNTTSSAQQRKCMRRNSESVLLSSLSGSNIGSGGGCVGGSGGGAGGGIGASRGSGILGIGHTEPLSSIMRDSFHEPGTSISERNSNSLASSRESSTSLSMKSQRRKISVSSHSGGKIPWCGCWGNGCL